MTEPDTVDATLRALLADVLGLGEDRAAALTGDSGLFGALPDPVTKPTLIRDDLRGPQLGVILSPDGTGRCVPCLRQPQPTPRSEH